MLCVHAPRSRLLSASDNTQSAPEAPQKRVVPAPLPLVPLFGRDATSVIFGLCSLRSALLAARSNSILYALFISRFPEIQQLQSAMTLLQKLINGGGPEDPTIIAVPGAVLIEENEVGEDEAIRAHNEALERCLKAQETLLQTQLFDIRKTPNQARITLIQEQSNEGLRRVTERKRFNQYMQIIGLICTILFILTIYIYPSGP